MRSSLKHFLLSLCVATLLTWLLYRKIKILTFICLVHFHVRSSDQISFLDVTSRELQAATPEAAQPSSMSTSEADKPVTSGPKPTKRILIYTTFFGDEWYSGYEREWSRECPACLVSRDRRDIAISNAVVFLSGNLKDIPPPEELSMLSRPPGQKWIFLCMEAPIAKKIYPGYYHLFNWSSTYDSRSDIPAPYGNYSFHHPGTPIFHVDFDIKQRDAILWMVSNPKSLYRNSIYLALREFVPIDVYGDFSPLSLPKGKLEKEFRRRYKFYFALENAVCSDYITEKYWNAINDGLIPIVLDFGNYRKNAIPNSYIDLNQFKSLKEAGHFIKKLSMNMTAYEEFFRWRHTYDPYTKDGSYICQICRALDDPFKSKEGTSSMFQEFYNEKECMSPSHIKETFFGYPFSVMVFLLLWLLVHCCLLGLGALYLILPTISCSGFFCRIFR